MFIVTVIQTGSHKDIDTLELVLITNLPFKEFSLPLPLRSESSDQAGLLHTTLCIEKQSDWN